MSEKRKTRLALGASVGDTIELDVCGEKIVLEFIAGRTRFCIVSDPSVKITRGEIDLQDKKVRVR